MDWLKISKKRRNQWSLKWFHQKRLFFGVVSIHFQKKNIPFLCLLGARPVAPVSSDPLVTEIGWEDPCCHLQKVKTWKVLFVYNSFLVNVVFSVFTIFFDHCLVLFWFYVQKFHAVTSKRFKIWKADPSIPWLICNPYIFSGFFFVFSR